MQSFINRLVVIFSLVIVVVNSPVACKLWNNEMQENCYKYKSKVAKLKSKCDDFVNNKDFLSDLNGENFSYYELFRDEIMKIKNILVEEENLITTMMEKNKFSHDNVKDLLEEFTEAEEIVKVAIISYNVTKLFMNLENVQKDLDSLQPKIANDETKKQILEAEIAKLNDYRSEIDLDSYFLSTNSLEGKLIPNSHFEGMLKQIASLREKIQDLEIED